MEFQSCPRPPKRPMPNPVSLNVNKKGLHSFFVHRPIYMCGIHMQAVLLFVKTSLRLYCCYPRIFVHEIPPVIPNQVCRQAGYLQYRSGTIHLTHNHADVYDPLGLTNRMGMCTALPFTVSTHRFTYSSKTPWTSLNSRVSRSV